MRWLPSSASWPMAIESLSQATATDAAAARRPLEVLGLNGRQFGVQLEAARRGGGGG